MTSLAVHPHQGLRFGQAGSVALFALLSVLAIGPILLVDIPAGVDYPNHLARMSILARDGTAAASRHYEVAWGLYPNLAMDLVVPRLAQLMSVETATRLFYLASQILIVSGSVAIELAVKRRFGIAGFAALLYLYSAPFAWGFVNFQFALGVALWGIAGWLAFGDRPYLVRLALHSFVVGLLFLSHLFALGIYGLTLGLCEIDALRRHRDRRHAAWIVAVLAVPAILAAAVFAAANGVVGGTATVWHLAAKPRWLFAINGYSLILSMAVTFGFAALIHALARRGQLRPIGPFWGLSAGYAAAFILLPFRLLDTAFVDVRMVVVAALVLPAFVAVRIADVRARALTAGLALAMLAANLSFSAYVQLTYRRVYSQVVESFSALPRGAKVLVAAPDAMTDPPPNLLDYPMFHAPVLAVHYADAFVPSLFTYPGKQPVLPRAHVWRLATMQGGPEPIGLLRDIAHETLTTSPPRDLATWTADLDFLYVIGTPGANPLPDVLAETARGEKFTLYRLKPRPPG
jgi:hypothetical protein